MHSTAFLILVRDPIWLKKRRKDKCPDKSTANLNSSPYNTGELINLPAELPESATFENEPMNLGLQVTLGMPIFYVLSLHCAWADYSSNTLMTTVVDYMKDKGSFEEKAENVIVYMSSTELVGRLLVPLLADKGALRRSTLVAVSFLILSIWTFSLPEVALYPGAATVCVMASLCFGCIHAMKGVLMADYLGIGRISVCFGCAGIAAVPLNLMGPSIIGE